MSHFQFQTVANIISGIGSIQELSPILAHKYHKALIVTDAGMIQHALHKPLVKILDDIGLDYEI